MDVVTALVFVILSYIVFAKNPAPLALIAWGFMGIFFLLGLIGAVTIGMVYIMFMLMIIVLVVGAVVENWR